MENNKTTSLTAKVENFKLIARDALRMELISPRLSNITAINKELESIEKDKADTEHRIKVETYEINTLDTNHPDYNQKKTQKEEKIQNLNERIKLIDKAIDETKQNLTEEQQAITKIETGETKVCLDSLNEMVDRLIKQDAYNQVKNQ